VHRQFAALVQVVKNRDRCFFANPAKKGGIT
jgi:hypothetical protein